MREDQASTYRNIKAISVNLHRVRKNDSSHTRVDINDLLSRVRDDEKKRKKENLVFFSLIASVIAVTGIIASL